MVEAVSALSCCISGPCVGFLERPFVSRGSAQDDWIPAANLESEDKRKEKPLMPFAVNCTGNKRIEGPGVRTGIYTAFPVKSQ